MIPKEHFLSIGGLHTWQKSFSLVALGGVFDTKD